MNESFRLSFVLVKIWIKFLSTINCFLLLKEGMLMQNGDKTDFFSISSNFIG